MPVAFHARTDVGVKRSHNQDSHAVSLAPNSDAWRGRGHLFVVADGMGAHAVGELASKMAVDTIGLSYTKARNSAVEDALRRAIVEANQSIHERGDQNKDFKGMGTTATALVLGPGGASIGHVGDSRCYRIRESTIEQLSFDHSLLWEVARKQNMQPEDIKSVPKNIIVRSLGPESQVNVDVNGPYPVLEGDRFLLCTDGLSGQVSDREIWSIVTYLPAEEACGFLIDLANYRGGIDNVTLILVQVGDSAHPKSAHPIAGWAKAREVALKVYRMAELRNWLLSVGLVLCAGGAAMKFWDLDGGLILATPGIAALLAGLGIYAWRRFSKQMKWVTPPPPPPPVFRLQPYTLTASIVEKMAKNEMYLREMAQEHEWVVDWDELNLRRDAAERKLAEHALPDAFREFCRAVSILFAGMRQARNKQEIFDPHWVGDRG